MTAPDHASDLIPGLRRPLGLTRAGMVAERVVRAFWPLWTVVFLILAALMFGAQDVLPQAAVLTGLALGVAGAVAALVLGLRRFRWPGRAEARARLDRTLPGRPISALDDSQAIGAADEASRAVWVAHQARMAERVRGVGPVAPDLRVAARDPFALRYVAVLALAMAAIFGSVWRVASVAEVVPGPGAGVLAAGPSWEGWIEPPAYTGKPTLYLADLADRISVPQASRLTLRLYGEVGDLRLSETVSGRVADAQGASEASQSLEIAQSGRLAIEGPGGRGWDVTVVPDALPVVTALGEAERGLAGEMRQRFRVQDDHGVVAGRAEISLDMAALDRRHGLAAEPEPRAPIVLDLPITIAGDRTDFEEVLIENLSLHPWATLPVRIAFFAEDALGQEGASAPLAIALPGRRFFDPLAGAIVEMRRDLLWSRENGPRVAQILRAISNRPDEVFRSETAYLKLRVALRRLEFFNGYGLSEDQRDEIAQVLWDVALMIEDGNLADAAERLRVARERLQEAMRNGATDEEIAELMNELREAMQDYMRQLAEQQGSQGADEPQGAENRQEITGDQLQALLDRLQELMEQGRMEEAQELLDRLAEMMQNMQVTQGEGQSPGQQAMEGLSDTLRRQQGLSDDTFRDLQERFDDPQDGGRQDGDEPGQEGRAPGQQGNTGRLPGEAGQEGEGSQQGEGQGTGQQGMPRPGQDGTGPGLSREALSDRQRALRQELDRQAGNLPGAGTEEGEAAREALDRAGRAMDEAEEALRNDDLAGAIDRQAEAIEALREGLRDLGEALARDAQPGQQGDSASEANQGRARDPLGREAGNNGQIGTDEFLLQGDDVYRRARELLDEIRRRSGEQDRPGLELDYLRRLLERF